ncbi:neprilysin-like [Amphiura filiformis]|uniref:neprilysin-like n=1 Tax=Amphiura filiformis TaxID=82378 RepID=UPI003B211A08
MASTESKTQLHMEEYPEVTKPFTAKFWKVLCGVLFLAAVGMLVGIIVLAVHEEEPPTPLPNTCSTSHCVVTAGKMIQNIDSSIDPCDNFFAFACGGWLKRTVIPEDRSSYSAYTALREEVQVVLKELFEREKSNDDITAVTKVKDFYASCVDLDRSAISRNAKQGLLPRRTICTLQEGIFRLHGYYSHHAWSRRRRGHY